MDLIKFRFPKHAQPNEMRQYSEKTESFNRIPCFGQTRCSHKCDTSTQIILKRIAKTEKKYMENVKYCTRIKDLKKRMEL